jgi:plasmid stabilization system protein ParE
LIEHIDYLQDQASFETALRFIDAVENAFKRLADWPEIGVRRKFSNTRLKEVRVMASAGFSQISDLLSVR